MKNHSIQFIIIILLLASNLSQADMKETKSNLTLNWIDLSVQEYVDNLVACESAIQAHKWSKSIWPKDNKSSKPDFSEVVKTDEIRQKVTSSLKKQAVLLDFFNFNITPAMLQHDLDRMAQNTKDPESLKQLFKTLKNDATTISQCISRPYLVQKKLVSQFNIHNKIHADTRALAEKELSYYKNNLNNVDLTAQTNSITYTIKTDQLLHNKGTEYEQDVIELDKVEFDQMYKQLKRNGLHEEDNAFVFKEVISEFTDSLQVKTLIWPKQSLNYWLMKLTYDYEITLPAETKLQLADIKPTTQSFDIKSITTDGWLPLSYKPDSVRDHTALWTGSEMIIWGGFDYYDFESTNMGGRYSPSTDSWEQISNINAPPAMFGHESIWTGTEIIVWGGYSDSDGTILGGLYNPTTNTWREMNIAHSPISRHVSSSIWTGSEMIVWGGVISSTPSNSTFFQTGGRYNPITNSWTETAIESAPNPRSGHSAVWTGSEMIIWGGTSEQSGLTNTGGKYNPNTNTWVPMSTLEAPTGRIRHSTIWTENKMIIWGGVNSNATRLNSGAKYNPETDFWEIIPTLNAPQARHSHTAVWTGSEMIIWGGYGNGASELNSGGRYDPELEIWKTMQNETASNGRSQHSAIWSGSEMIIWGGSGNNGSRYNPTSDSWLKIGGSGDPSRRTNHSAVWSGHEMLLWGGKLGMNNFIEDGSKYTPSTDSWEKINKPNFSLYREHHTAIWTGEEMIVWGGYTQSNNNTGGRYNPITESWSKTSSEDAPYYRYNHTAIWTGNEMVVWGGKYTNTALNTGGKYNPETDSWKETNTLNAPSARNDHIAIWTGSEMIIWGGVSNTTLNNSGGRYNPVNDSWIATSTIGAPSKRARHTAIWTDEEMIIWGGYSHPPNSYNISGGRYNPNLDIWKATNTFNAPSPRDSHTSIWTGSEMIIWGGKKFSDLSNNGGKYNPETDSWEETNSLKAPPARKNHTAIWTGDSMIIWGGEPYTSSFGIYSRNVEFFVVVGYASGLIPGNQLTLQLNDDSNLVISENGAFAFTFVLENGALYDVTISEQANNPIQPCTITNGSGQINGLDVFDVALNCEFGLDLIYRSGFDGH